VHRAVLYRRALRQMPESIDEILPLPLPETLD
jgi:hypothetical protein